MNYIIIIFCSIVLPIFSLRQIKSKFCINCKYFIADNYNGEHGKCSLFEIETFPTYNDKFLVNGISKDENKIINGISKDYLFVQSQEFGIISAEQKENCMKKNIQKKTKFYKKKETYRFCFASTF